MALLKNGMFLLLFLLGCGVVMVTGDEEVVLCEYRKSNVLCVCGFSAIEVPLQYCRGWGESQCYPCNETLTIMDICSRYAYCQHCDHVSKTCDQCLPGFTGKYCEERIQPLPKEGPLRRYKRHSHCCPLPSDFETADLHCNETTGGLSCVLQCIWGYKLRGNDAQHFQCDCQDPKWKPFDLEECKPYVNCEIRFTGKAPGHKKCTSAGVNKPVTCDLTCANQQTTHTCNLDGTWNPPLPDCVENMTEQLQPDASGQR